ncbi:GntR family transcriptional regulator [Acuticoccus mangrovi]|uniref:GntR family transcriptional regulator n=1 Tax=Acuticoccus mangrovi TaxID=2796142 RepID=A0A934IPF0_9HYPH|nr:GntR family transcriptional regulator [Acuticoccus mangrovi]MBJ3778621.1 GntR family transcriptional regulator [Acuticoccus mangrovi]
MSATDPSGTLGDTAARGFYPEMVYQRLRLDILNATFEPGTILRQQELAERYQVSRVPLREAMTRLTAEGMLILRPRRGYAVISLEPDQIVEVFELRAVIEEHAGYVAARARTKDDVRRLDALIVAMEALDPASARYVDDWSSLNYDFHVCLVGSTRRERLARTAAALRDTVEPYIRIESRLTGDMKHAEREHREIAQAFKAGDATSLAALCRQHVEHTAQRLLRQIRQRSAATSPTHLS